MMYKPDCLFKAIFSIDLTYHFTEVCMYSSVQYTYKGYMDKSHNILVPTFHKNRFNNYSNKIRWYFLSISVPLFHTWYEVNSEYFSTFYNESSLYIKTKLFYRIWYYFSVKIYADRFEDFTFISLLILTALYKTNYSILYQTDWIELLYKERLSTNYFLLETGLCIALSKW